MDLKQLEYFVGVANAGSFTRASMKLAVDQPALSKQIRRLEVELKLVLFRRNGRGIALTEAGETLLAHATRILGEVEQTRRALDAVRGETLGKLAIAMPAVAKKVLTTDFINAFRTRFPRASLEIIEGKSRLIQDWLLDGRIDIGLVHGSSLRPGIEIVRHTNHELYLVSPRQTGLFRPGATVPFTRLQELPLILPAAPHSIRVLLDSQAAKAGIALNVVLQVDGAQFVLDLVQQGHGYTVLPAFSVTMRNMSDALQQNEIVQPRLTRALSVAISAQRPVTRVARESIELLEQYLVA
jgi:LysR family transcriptional regulator, nitrogen assimilation regulatory protein